MSYEVGTLPAGISSRIVSGINGLDVHVLEAGAAPGRPVLLLQHGFPELAWSWRKVMPALADAGYHVIAPDLRGYGRTTGWDARYDGDIHSFRLLSFVRDALALVFALGHRSVHGVIGHDYGSPVAAWCALVRPDVFRRVALMSAPFGGPPALPFDTADTAAPPPAARDIDGDLARLARPREHYRWFYSTPEANDDLSRAPQGVHNFLRAYYHMKSADWKANRPHSLASWDAGVLAEMPEYYIMERGVGMAATVAREMPTAQEIAACRWLPDEELAVYVAEYERNGFQGGLQSYRCGTDPALSADLGVFAGRAIEVPACFIAGTSDWGAHQSPGALERMQSHGCTRFEGNHFIDGAGHWVQQEQPGAVVDVLTDFLART